MIKFVDTNGVVHDIAKIVRNTSGYETSWAKWTFAKNLYVGGHKVFTLPEMFKIEWVCKDSYPAGASDFWFEFPIAGTYRLTCVGRGGKSYHYGDWNTSPYTNVCAAGGGSGAYAVKDYVASAGSSVKVYLNFRNDTAGAEAGRVAMSIDNRNMYCGAAGGKNASGSAGNPTAGAGGSILAGDSSMSFAGVSGTTEVLSEEYGEISGCGGSPVGSAISGIKYGAGGSANLNDKGRWIADSFYPFEKKSLSGYASIERIA